MQSTWNYFFGI